MSNSYFDMSALSPETVTKVLHMDDDSIGRVSDTGEDTYKGPIRQTTSDQSFPVTFTCCVDAAERLLVHLERQWLFVTEAEEEPTLTDVFIMLRCGILEHACELSPG